MSAGAKAFVGVTCAAVAGVVWFVHHNQTQERLRMKATVMAEKEEEAAQRRALRHAMSVAKRSPEMLAAQANTAGGASGAIELQSGPAAEGSDDVDCIVCEAKRTRIRPAAA